MLGDIDNAGYSVFVALKQIMFAKIIDRTPDHICSNCRKGLFGIDGLETDLIIECILNNRIVLSAYYN